MAWWMAIPAVIGAASAYSQKKQGDAIARDQVYWNRYNAQQAFNTEAGNIAAQGMIAKANAALTIASAEVNTDINKARMEMNSMNVGEVALYNDQIFEDELSLVWEQEGLDQELLRRQRARERGSMEAAQSVSGTIMGIDSNADVIIDQKSQEAFDSFVVKHGADLSAKRVNDARARSLWDAQQELKKISFEGAMFEIATKTQAHMSAAGMLTEQAISGSAGIASANSALKSNMASANMGYAQQQTVNRNAFIKGMTSSLSQGFSAVAGTTTPSGGGGGVGTGAGGGGSAGSSLITTSGMNWGGR